MICYLTIWNYDDKYHLRYYCDCCFNDVHFFIVEYSYCLEKNSMGAKMAKEDQGHFQSPNQRTGFSHMTQWQAQHNVVVLEDETRDNDELQQSILRHDFRRPLVILSVLCLRTTKQEAKFNLWRIRWCLCFWTMERLQKKLTRPYCIPQFEMNFHMTAELTFPVFNPNVWCSAFRHWPFKPLTYFWNHDVTAPLRRIMRRTWPAYERRLERYTKVETKKEDRNISSLSILSDERRAWIMSWHIKDDKERKHFGNMLHLWINSFRVSTILRIYPLWDK